MAEKPSLRSTLDACAIRFGRYSAEGVQARIAELRECADKDLLDLMYPDECHALLDLYETALTQEHR